MVRDQLAESIDAASELRQRGRTVRADGGHIADEAKPDSDMGASVKKAAEACHPEAVAAAVAVTVAMANP